MRAEISNNERMETRRLAGLGELETIYFTRMTQDFARNELRPFSSIRESWERGEYEGYALYDSSNVLLGYALFVRLGSDTGNEYLFDYFAISAESRGRGLGSFFLRQLAAYLKGASCIVGEAEDPSAAADEEERENRKRRLRFYLKNGCRETELRSLVFGVDYLIFEVPTGTEHSTEELAEVYTRLYQSTLRPYYFKTCFRIKGT